MKKLFTENKGNVWFWLFVGIAVILFFAMPLMSRSAGNSGDEDKFQIPQGRFVMDYYHSDGADTTCMKDAVELNGKMQSWNLKYYGCSFDVVTEWINETFGIEDIARTRHMCNAFMGWLIVLFGGLIAYRIGGWRAGVFAMLLLFLSPRLLGHSFNNPKDIPLAAGITMSIYYMMMFFRQLTPVRAQTESGERKTEKGKKPVAKVLFPEQPFSDKATLYISIILLVVAAPLLFVTAGVALTLLILGLFVVALCIKNTPKFNPLTLFMLALSLALAVSNRIGGLIAVGYMGLWGLLWLIRDGRKMGGATVGKALAAAIGTCMAGFFAGLVLWPYAMQNPIGNSIESFRLMSQFDVQLRQLFEGEMMMSGNLPWYYTPKFMLMTIPLAVIIGWLIYPFFGGFNKERRIDSVMVYFCFLFPVCWIVITDANVYGGWRHSLFTYPPMAIAAGLGFDIFAKWLGTRFSKRWLEAVGVALPLLLMLPPAIHTVRNHPFEYVYFNELSGGVKNAFGHYELDYYYHSMRQATEWVMENAEPRVDGEKTLVGTWHVESTRYFLRGDTTHFQTRFVRWGQRYEYDWDYMVFPLTGVSGQYLLSPSFPPKDCVHTIDVDGMPIALILKRQTKDDFYALQLMKEGKVDSAVTLFNNVLAINPDNETALQYLSSIYLQQGKYDEAIALCNRLLAADPSNPSAGQVLVYSYLNSGKSQEAAALLDKLKAEGSQAYPYSISAQLYAGRGDLSSAMAEINSMLSHGLMDQESLNLYVRLSAMNGTPEQAAVFSFYNSYANGLERKGDKKAADNLRKQMNGK